ncbi:MAG: universal stress protein [Deltaproteobacteria bacterium]|nr:universal stress protein [Deltaproteobacteria bacterium]
MNDFQNVLYAIDLDDEHITSIVDAVEFAKRFRSRIHFLYVNDLEAGYRHPTDREDAVALKVRETVPADFLKDMDIVYASSKGTTADEIVRYVREHSIDLLIVGHRHRSKIYSSLFDSTDVNIIDLALLPILVIPEK